MIEVSGVQLSYGTTPVLRNVAFEVAEGEGFAIIGPNGAGKTTLFKALTGEVYPSHGAIRYFGHDIAMTPAYMRVQMGFGRTFQVARIFSESSVVDNIIVAVEARLKSEGCPAAPWYAWKPARSVIEEALDRLDEIGLFGQRFAEANTLSLGDKKRLELAVTLALNPRILMLDEPTAGMSPPERKRVVELIQRIRSRLGITIMLTEHDMDVVFGLADRIMVLNYGEVIAVGAPQEVRRNPTVMEIYLGKESYVAES